jgi:hypothetical protein
MKILRAKRDAFILRAAERILDRLEKDSQRRRQELIEASNWSPAGERHAFVRVLYEAWLFLVGDRPGTNPNFERNPFLRFIKAAWIDWKGEDAEEVSFVQSLNVAKEDVSDWECEQIVSRGPTWWP